MALSQGCWKRIRIMFTVPGLHATTIMLDWAHTVFLSCDLKCTHLKVNCNFSMSSLICEPFPECHVLLPHSNIPHYQAIL